MQPLIGHVLSVFMAFFAIMNPITTTPTFLSLTANDTPAVQKRVAAKAVAFAFLLIVVFTLLGKVIFQLFGITMPAFRIAGGLLVAQIGFRMLSSAPSTSSSAVSTGSADGKESLQAALSVAVSPLGIPLLAGPGTIATAMNFASTGSLMEMLITIGAFAVMCLITFVFFVSGEKLVGFLGQSGLEAITKIMGLILAVIGVQMVIQGITGAIQMATGAG